MEQLATFARDGVVGRAVGDGAGGEHKARDSDDGCNGLRVTEEPVVDITIAGVRGHLLPDVFVEVSVSAPPPCAPNWDSDPSWALRTAVRACA